MLKLHNPKNATVADRWNRARAALLGYKREAGIDESYISGVSDDSILRGMLVDIQLMLVRKEGERNRLILEADNVPYEPHFTNHPDAVGLEFLVNIGFMDIYLGADTTSYTFIVITGKEGGEYTTTNNLLRMLPGFFDTER